MDRMQNKIIKLLLLFLLSLGISNDLTALDIVNTAINRLNGKDISFNCAVKYQSLSSEEPIYYNFNSYTYWPSNDSLSYYNYVKFSSPIDYKDIEIWGYYNPDEFILKKRIPAQDNKIVLIDDESKNLNLIDFFNFVDLFEEIKNRELRLKNKNINGHEIYLVSAYLKEEDSGKKSIKFFINKDNYAIERIEWTNKRGIIIKSLLFEEWLMVNDIYFSSKMIYEDTKKEFKVTCNLSKINFESFNEELIDLIKLGFNFDN